MDDVDITANCRRRPLDKPLAAALTEGQGGRHRYQYCTVPYVCGLAYTYLVGAPLSNVPSDKLLLLLMLIGCSCCWCKRDAEMFG
jgi:hypothetical protein